MKKAYQSPAIKVKQGECEEEMLAGSSVTDSGSGIGFGGTDTGGSKDPDAKRGAWGSDNFPASVWDE